MIVMYVNITLSDDDNTVVTIDNSTLESISSQITTAVSTSEPSYGIKAGSGSIVFKDVGKQFVAYSKEGYLNSSNKIEVYLKDTISGKEQLCGVWLSKEWNYDTDDETVNITLRDNLEILQDVTMVDSLYYTELNDINESKTAYELLSVMETYTPSDFEIKELEDSVLTLLKNIVIQNLYLESGSLWSWYDKLSELAMLNIYKTMGGEIEIIQII